MITPKYPDTSQISAADMTLRDFFATHATEEDIAEYMPKTQDKCDALRGKLNIAFTASLRPWARYKYADAMLEERAKLTKENKP